MRWLTVLTILLSTLALSSCKGADGPAGPPGPEGPQGPQGPGSPGGASRLNFMGLIPGSGTISVPLPEGAGNNPAAPPSLTCWISNSDEGPWLVVTDGYSEETAYCAAGHHDGVWHASLIQGTPGWYAAMTIVY